MARAACKTQMQVPHATPWAKPTQFGWLVGHAFRPTDGVSPKLWSHSMMVAVTTVNKINQTGQQDSRDPMAS